MHIKQLHGLFSRSQGVCTDTRQLKPGSLFFALRGENFNANRFAKEAIEKGASYVVVDELLDDVPHQQVIQVNNVLETLWELASFHRTLFNIPVIGITGTNGKTTCKELISSVLQAGFRVLATRGNLNNHIGVPLTLLAITRETEIAVIEMGANHPGEIEQLCGLARPGMGLITTIGKAHLEGFGSLEGVIQTKQALYTYCMQHDGQVFVNAANGLLMSLSAAYPGRILYGDSPQALYSCKPVAGSSFAALHLQWQGQGHDIQSRLYGSYNVENMAAAVAFGLHLGIPLEKVKTAIEAYEPRNNRSQVINSARNTLVLDAYNANPSSMQASLESFLSFPAERKTVILGDMLELGPYSGKEHLKLIYWLQEHPDIQALLVGPVFSDLAQQFGIPCYPDALTLAGELLKQPIQNHTILIKGSRGIQLELLLDSL